MTKNETKINTIKEEFSGKNLTIFGGTGLIRRWFYKIKLISLLKMIEMKKERDNGYQPVEMFLSIIYGIILGLARPYHMAELKMDKVFQKLANLKDFPSQSTISRFFSRVTMKISSEISNVNKILLLIMRRKFNKYKQEGITLDLDSHVYSVYGNQQRASSGYNPKKKGRKSYHPIICFIGETRDFVGGFLRSGRHHTSYQWKKLLNSTIKILPIKIRRLRADSGFFSAEFMTWVNKKKIEYFISVPLNRKIQKKILYDGH